jgi:hypothetical protein
MKTVWTLLPIMFTMLAIGCSTVAPGPLKDSEPSFEGNQQTSGFLGFNDEGFGLITEHAKDRYNCLAALYGDYFVPTLKPDEGLSWTPAVNGQLAWRIDREHLVKFATMNRWYKEGKPIKAIPPKTP